MLVSCQLKILILSGHLPQVANTIGSPNLRLLGLQDLSVGQQVHSLIFLSMTLGKHLTFLQGWLSIFARLAICASAAFVAGQMIQGLVILNVENYEPLRWHGTLMYWAILLLSVLVNILGVGIFPHIETVAFICHICFFFALLVPLVYLSPQSTAKFVFTDFENVGGWHSNGVSWFLGLLTSAWSFVGKHETNCSERQTDFV